MTVVFASNYYNHHQSGFCAEMDRLTGHNFYFIETEPMEEERKNLGWHAEHPAYVICAYAPGKQEQCKTLLSKADVVLWGSCPFSMVLPRLLARRLTLYVSERNFKSGKSGVLFLARYVKYSLMFAALQKNQWVLCCSAYAAADYALMGQFRGRCFRWGYFPECRHYDIPVLPAAKVPQRILWTARLIPWKHPEHAIETARRLKESGYTFQMELVGSGPMEEALRSSINALGLSDCVTLSGAVTPEQVREKMETASIFLATSDQNEGWGAVLNEAMNSACAVVACRAMGAAPFLIRDGENGFLYAVGDTDALFAHTKALLDNSLLAQSIGVQACETIQTHWNVRIASERLMQLLSDLTETGTPGQLPEDGPCSIAPILND